MEIKLFVATKAFILYENKVLIVKESSRYKEGVNTGKFDVVGGRISPGESLQEALKREVLEETGLDIKIGNIFFANEARPTLEGKTCQIIRMFFTCQANKDEVRLSQDHEEFLWIDPQKYQDYTIIENLHEVFEEFLKINSLKD
ncbi:MAG: NUDIX domain-containing protein [Nanoarchaeota archaeon]|nr:NUDIX domain-containing protein [Nanoarchaeota archaeon]